MLRRWIYVGDWRLRNMPYRLIYNPTAGGGQAKAIVDSLTPLLASIPDLEVLATRERGHATELARAVSTRPAQVIISIGGDGTHHEVVNGMLPAGTAELAVIPAGSGNDFAMGMNLPKNPTAALKIAMEAKAVAVDVGQANQEYFLTVVGSGFDAEVAGYINSRPHAGTGKWLYLRGILHMLMQYRSQSLTVVQNGHPRTRSTLLLAVGNTARYAGGIRICPQADAQDGLLQVVWVGGVSPLQVLPLLAKAYGGHHVNDRRVETFNATELQVEGPAHLNVHADGELIGHLPMTIRVHPKALKLRLEQG